MTQNNIDRHGVLLVSAWRANCLHDTVDKHELEFVADAIIDFSNTVFDSEDDLRKPGGYDRVAYHAGVILATALWASKDAGGYTVECLQRRLNELRGQSKTIRKVVARLDELGLKQTELRELSIEELSLNLVGLRNAVALETDSHAQVCGDRAELMDAVRSFLVERLGHFA